MPSFRISIRGLMVITAIASVFFALVAVQMRAHRKIRLAVEELSKSGVSWYSEPDTSTPYAVFLEDVVLNDKLWKRIGDVTSLRQISMLFTDPSSETTDESLQFLGHLHALEALALPKSQITGVGLRFLRTCPNLRQLELLDSPITDAGCLEIRKSCPRLEEIRFSETRMTEKGLKELLSIPSLRHIAVDGHFEQVPFGFFDNCRSLSRFSIEGTLGDIEVGNLPKLSELSIGAFGTKRGASRSSVEGTLEDVEVGDLPKLSELPLSAYRTKRGARSLSLLNLPSLTHVVFGGRGTFTATQVPSIRELFFSDTSQVKLKGIETLTSLEFEFCDFRDRNSVFVYEGGPIQLVTVRLCDAPEILLAGLAKSDQVIRLDLYINEMSNATLNSIARMKSLTSLMVLGDFELNVDDNFFRRSNLKWVRLQVQSGMSLRTWFRLCVNMPQLSALELAQCNVFEDDIKWFQDRRPDVKLSMERIRRLEEEDKSKGLFDEVE